MARKAMLPVIRPSQLILIAFEMAVKYTYFRSSLFASYFSSCVHAIQTTIGIETVFQRATVQLRVKFEALKRYQTLYLLTTNANMKGTVQTRSLLFFGCWLLGVTVGMGVHVQTSGVEKSMPSCKTRRGRIVVVIVVVGFHQLEGG
jgi:hypothetical protein